MSEGLLIGVLSGQDLLLLTLIGWLHFRQSSHERLCETRRESDRVSRDRLMQEHGRLLAMAEIWERKQ
jgi:hypothetical protein